MSDCGVVAACSRVGVGLGDAFCVGSVRVTPDHVSTRDIAVSHECYINDMRIILVAEGPCTGAYWKWSVTPGASVGIFGSWETWLASRNATGQGSIYVDGYRKPEGRNMMLVHFNSLINIWTNFKIKMAEQNLTLCRERISLHRVFNIVLDI